jgi:hypothetical protein
MKNKITELLNDDYQKLKVVGTQMIQLQIMQDDEDAYIDLSRNEAKELAKALLEHCKEVEK